MDMDTANALAQLLGNGIFPIGMVVILCIFIKYMMDKFNSTLEELKQSIDTMNARIDTIIDKVIKEDNNDKR